MNTVTSTRTAALALFGLLAVAVAWGSSFPITRVVLREMTAAQFLAVRFAIAAIVMLALFHRVVLTLPRRVLVHGLVLGGLYGVAQLVQTVGLETTPASISGFITGLYVVLTPMCAAILLHTPIGLRVWVGAAMATVGLGILALQDLSLGFGEIVTLISALLYALHIVGLGAWSTARQALGLSVVQITACAVVSVIAAAPGGYALPTSGSTWAAIIYMALISGALAMFVQSWAQAHLAPSRAAIIMSTEPVWAATLAVMFIGEALTWRIVVGGSIMLAAMLLVELAPRSPTMPPGPEELPKLTG
jgi:drug/metabolite transporter (DMT)-like permease